MGLMDFEFEGKDAVAEFNRRRRVIKRQLALWLTFMIEWEEVPEDVVDRMASFLVDYGGERGGNPTAKALHAIAKARDMQAAGELSNYSAHVTAEFRDIVIEFGGVWERFACAAPPNRPPNPSDIVGDFEFDEF